MNILIISEVCSPEKYAQIEQGRKIKLLPSQQNYFWRLVNAISKQSGVNVECVTIPPVSPSCHSQVIWENATEVYSPTLKYSYLGFKNTKLRRLTGLSKSIKRACKKWAEQNKSQESYIIVDVLDAIFLNGAIKAAKKHNIPVIGIVTDIPHYITTVNYSKSSLVKKLIRRVLDLYSKRFIERLDGYIFLTKYMNEKINISGKPHTIIEGIATEENTAPESPDNESGKFTLLYAGGLYEKFGVCTLADAVMSIDNDKLEMLFYGQGDAVDYIKGCGEKDGRIKYKGVAAAKDMPALMQSADLLLNARPTGEPYTKYSFPSKTLEYMASGTALLSTRLEGIPNEYDGYILWFEGETVSAMADSIRKVLDKDRKALQQHGKKAREFVLRNKNGEISAVKALDFLKTLIK